MVINIQTIITVYFNFILTLIGHFAFEFLRVRSAGIVYTDRQLFKYQILNTTGHL